MTKLAMLGGGFGLLFCVACSLDTNEPTEEPQAQQTSQASVLGEEPVGSDTTGVQTPDEVLMDPDTDGPISAEELSFMFGTWRVDMESTVRERVAPQDLEDALAVAGRMEMRFGFDPEGAMSIWMRGDSSVDEEAGRWKSLGRQGDTFVFEMTSVEEEVERFEIVRSEGGLLLRFADAREALALVAVVEDQD